MPSSQPQRSTYRDRRINAMLQESSAKGKNGIRTATEPGVRAPSTGRTSRPAMLGIGLATAGLCALAVFFLLFRHDTSRVMTNVPVQPVRTAPQSAPTPVDKPLAQEAAPLQPAQPSLQSAAPSTARVQFRISRYNRTQTVGPLNLRLISTSARKGFCSVLIGAAISRPNQYTIQVNRPVKVTADSNKNVSVLVTAIGKTSISGYVTGG